MKKIVFSILIVIGFSVCSMAKSKHSNVTKYPTYKGLVMAGYQGWFNCEGDGAGRGWTHYNKKGVFEDGSCTIDFWPEMDEYKVKYKTPFKFIDGSPAYVFSSYDESTVDLHFKWMKEYGIDGVFMQRFFSVLTSKERLKHNDKVLASAIKAASKYGIAISLMYDIGSMDDSQYKLVMEDWKHLVDDLKLTNQGEKTTYLFHNSKPLVAFWGISAGTRESGHIPEIFDIIDFFKNDPVYGGCSIHLGIPSRWRTLGSDTKGDPRLHEVIKQADVVHPWLVGRYNEASYEAYRKEQIVEDVKWCKEMGKSYAPTVFPGFSWYNMKDNEISDKIPRNKGEFYWKQLAGAIESGAEMLYVAMFDEIDEGTAIMKCAKTVPVGKSIFVPIEKEIRTDHYLWLTGQAGKMLRGEIPFSRTMPVAIPGTAIAGNQPSSVPKKKPNVIILFSDQHNKDVMGFEGHPDVITPNLDRLAKQSVVFDRAYCVTGICAPSRSSLLSGLYPRTMGLLSNSEKSSVLNEAVSLATIFQQNNYKTFAFGKRHTSGAVDAGWDVHRSHLCNETPGNSYTEWVEKNGYAKEFAQDWSAEFGKGSPCSSLSNEKIPTADLGTRISALPETMTMEAFTTGLTVQMIKDQAKSNQPFFCWSTFYRPHQPYTPLKKYMDMYNVSTWGEGTRKGSSVRKPSSLYEPKENIPPMMQSIRDGGNKVWNVDKAFADEQLWRNHVGAYYALVTEIDNCVGEILRALDEAGISEETIVIYTSDHGDFVGNHGMVEKSAAGQNVYEDILNIPLIIRYPGNKQSGKRSAELVSLVDIYPTLVDLLGLKLPKMKYPVQGQSFAGTLTKGKPMKREYFVSESWSQATVITKDYKLGIMIDPTDFARKFDFRAFGDQFFVRKNDSLEIDNQIKNTRYNTEIERLRGFYNDFAEKIPDVGKQEVIKNAKK